jgi:ABC-type glycerol-3-phosphate transport system permease component
MRPELTQTAPAPALATPVRASRFFATRRQADRANQVVLVLVLGLGALAMLLPFVWMATTSLSRSANIAMPRLPTFWPADPSLFNYEVALKNLPVLRYYGNSLIVTTGATLGLLLFSSMAGYAFAKGHFVGKTVLFVMLLTTLMIPFEMRMIPMYLLMRDLGLNDTLLALILPFVAGGFGTFLMRQYITSIPDELVDAARVDGANELTIYWRIILPLCGPVLAALAVLSALWRWNDVLWPLLVLSDKANYTITLGLAVAGRAAGTYTGLALAQTSLAVIPIIVLYVLLQRYIVRGVMLSGLKG